MPRRLLGERRYNSYSFSTSALDGLKTKKYINLGEEEPL
jgi:hypothetical protein